MKMICMIQNTYSVHLFSPKALGVQNNVSIYTGGPEQPVST